MEIDKKLVGERISNIRKKLGLTMELFGFKVLNADRSLVSKWEKGKALPNNARVKILAELGNISVNELLYGSFENYISNVILENSNEDFIQRDVLDMTIKEANKLNLTYGQDQELYNLYKDLFTLKIKQTTANVLRKMELTDSELEGKTEYKTEYLKKNLRDSLNLINKDTKSGLTNIEAAATTTEHLFLALNQINSLYKK